MKKRLYISDLDGTLLNSQAALSKNTIDVLNSAIANGINFTIATARTAATSLKMLESVNLNLPVILMNGVCIYDIKNNSYLKTIPIGKSSLLRIFSIFKEQNIDGFAYSVDKNKLLTFYEHVRSPNAEAFIQERREKYGKAFTQVNDFSECIENNIVYYSVSNKKEILDPVYNLLKLDSNLNIEYYRDIYNEDFWYLEICSHHASKYNAVVYIRNKYNFSHVTAFGDNLNDISMFRACDKSYAVLNAKPEVKANAYGIIGKNTDDAVALWIQKHAY